MSETRKTVTSYTIPVTSPINDNSGLFFPQPPRPPPIPSTTLIRTQVYTVSCYRYHALLRATRIPRTRKQNKSTFNHSRFKWLNNFIFLVSHKLLNDFIDCPSYKLKFLLIYLTILFPLCQQYILRVLF